MRIRLAIPDRHVSSDVLDAALEATTRAAHAQMAAGEAPTFSELLRSGVKWRPESFADGEHFDLPSVVGMRGWGDCDDLAPALAGELRVRGIDPGARARVVRTGPERWHAVVQLSDGQIVDPSRMAGMRGTRSIAGRATVRPMSTVGQSAVAITPYGGRWWARTDVPCGDIHVASLASSRDPARALSASIEGAVAIGGGLGWPHYEDRRTLAALWADARTGSPREPVWARYPWGPIVARFE